MTLDEMEALWLARFGPVLHWSEVEMTDETIDFWQKIYWKLHAAKLVRTDAKKQTHVLCNYVKNDN